MTRLSKLGLFLLLAGPLAAQQTIQYGYDAAGRLVSASYDNGTSIAYTYDNAGNLLRREVTAGGNPVATVSSATFEADAALAAEMIVSGFGLGVGTGAADVTELPLPTELLGTTIEVTDSQGTAQLAKFFALRENQANYLIPAGTALGPATIKVTSGSGNMLTGVVQIEAVAPGIYTANAQGTGLAAALVIHIRGDGSVEQTLTFDPFTGASVPIDLGAEDDQVFVALFGTGMRGAATPATATVGGEATAVLGPVPHAVFEGLDQANLGALSRALAGRGDVDIDFMVDGKAANTVSVNIL